MFTFFTNDGIIFKKVIVVSPWDNPFGVNLALGKAITADIYRYGSLTNTWYFAQDFDGAEWSLDGFTVIDNRNI
jgi:hypothetical protein